MTDQPLRLMFQDEARFGLIGDPRRCWAPFPLRPLVKVEIVQQVFIRLCGLVSA
ncbi:MAG: hypothetical protein ACYCYP_13365 [Leptospirales bacterium]